MLTYQAIRATSKTLQALAAKHAGNSHFTGDQFKNSSLSYLLHVASNGLILADLSYSADAAAVRFDSLHVQQNYKNQGHATALVRDIFRMAHGQKATLQITTPFLSEGEDYLAPTMARIHREFPDLRILYPGQKEPVDGNIPYKLKFGFKGRMRLEFE